MDIARSHCTYDVGKGIGRSGDLDAGKLEAGRPLILLVASENVQAWGWLLWTSCECPAQVATALLPQTSCFGYP